MDILKSIKSEIQSDINTLLDHPFILNLQQGNLSMNDIKTFGEQYYILSCAFTQFLILASASITNEKHRSPIIDNIYDEHGRGNYLHSHRILLLKFLSSLGVESVEYIEPFPSTMANIYGMKKLCESGDPLEVIGAIGPGCEYFTDTQYSKLVKPLSEKYSFTSDDLHFFHEHIDHDPRHTSDIDNIILEIVKDENDLKKVVFGAKQAVIFETLFWDGLWKSCQL